MSDGQFWFVMTCIFILLDTIAYRTRAREQREHRDWLATYDAESRRRHDDFMTALAQERRDRGMPSRKPRLPS